MAGVFARPATHRDAAGTPHDQAISVLPSDIRIRIRAIAVSYDMTTRTENSPLAAAPSPYEETPPSVAKTTLAAWRAELARIREEERKRPQDLPAETGRLLEIVGQALAQDGGPLPAHDIARIEELTQVAATYR